MRNPSKTSRPVFVGIGASAGALETLQRFFSLVPTDGGIVYIVVQHLERHHPSVLADILGKHTKMPVQQAENETRAEANHVYIIPPNAELTLQRGVLHVERSAAQGLRTPIDTFLRSLARDQGELAIGIIFSGAGSDGTAGLRVIKENGGLTLAQAPETAKYDSMPQNAIAAGLVDFALPVEEMPARIMSHAGRVADDQAATQAEWDDQVLAHLGAINEILRRQTGHDFSEYKQGTLLRRLRRRIQLQQAPSVIEYIEYLKQNPVEVEQLHRDMLIGVTHFFRDAEIFELLATSVIPAIVERRRNTQIRIWVPGCASGEEAYSIAILVRERLTGIDPGPLVHIFATDIDNELLTLARLGRYSDKIAEHVSAERLQRYFTHDTTGYQVTKTLREMCTFSEHSLIRDPPFSSLDLISCRNVLIYLGPDLQKKLVPLFHYALRPGGFLLLGPSESLSAYAELFTTLDKKSRLFLRNDAIVRPPLEFPFGGRYMPRQLPPRLEQEVEPVTPQMFSRAFERMILEEYAPPAAVTNEQGDILYLAGRAGRYLQVAAGAPSNNIFDLAQGILRVELRSALMKAVSSKRRVVRNDLVTEIDGVSERLRLTARPLPGIEQASGLYAIVLQTMGADLDNEIEAIPSSDRPIIEELENELRTTRANLQSAMQDLESSNEELKSANEELISTNEELQSSNEELQTSKEELQAANDELRTKVLELDAANSDLQYHFAGTNIITIFLDRSLRIVRCTPAASQLFNVLESDIGRPFRDLAPRFVEEDVLENIASVLRTETGVERQVHRRDDLAWFLVRILPYRSQEKAVTGVGVTFVDISHIRRAQEAERRYGRLLLLSPEAISVWRVGEGTETWSVGAEQLYGFTSEETKGKDPRELLQEVFPCPWAQIEKALHDTGRWDGEVESRTKAGRHVTVLARLAFMRDEDGVERILQSDRDITDRRIADAERERLILTLREAEHRKNDFLAMLSHELRNPLAPIRNSLFVLDRAATGGEQAQRAKAIIERQVTQLSRLVDDLLDVTRISRGKLQVQRSRLEVVDLVRRTVEDHRSMIADAGLHLDLGTTPQPMWINGDAARLSQAIGNLLSNAIKFTHRGGHVFVQLEQDTGRNLALIRIRDDGAGIDPSVLPHLFEPFAQGEHTLDRSRGGLGLGLALAKGLVEQHGGELHGTSDGPGKGAEFTICLPLADPFPPAIAPTTGSSTQIERRRVLVIEDNVDAAESLRTALEFDEHEVEVAHTGTEGLKKIRAFRPDVVLCDIGLPELDGYGVARAVRADPELRDVPLVALTGYALPEDLAKARKAGFDRHVAKPPTMELLAEILRATKPMKWGAGVDKPEKK